MKLTKTIVAPLRFRVTESVGRFQPFRINGLLMVYPVRNRTCPGDWNYTRNVTKWRGIARPRIDRHNGVNRE